MNLKEIIENKESGSYKKDNNVPTFVTTPTIKIPVMKSKRSYKKKAFNKNLFLRIGVIVAGVVVLLVGFIYLPQLFIPDNDENTNFGMVIADSKAIRESYISDNPDKDFDGDGLTNSDELSIGSNIYKPDTDNDGILDDTDKNPNTYDKTLSDSLKTEGIFPKTAFDMNGVLMWADDEQSLVKGGVILMPNGNYRFSNFKGWVSFPNDNITAYKYKNGYHVAVEYKETENAWRIYEDCEITIVNEPPDFIHKLTIFGNVHYLDDTGFSRFISTILPEKGWLTSTRIWLDDTFTDYNNTVMATNTNVDYVNLPDSRFSSNDITMEDINMVYRTIEKGDSVLVSLYNETHGETLINVIGYTLDGNLIVSNPSESQYTSSLYVLPSSAKTLSENGKVTLREWVDYYGCGYDTRNGDVISFVSSSIEKEIEPIVTEKEFDIEPDTAPTAPSLPENGTFVSDGNTYYYIDGVFATDSFIRLNKKKYEYCDITDNGAFYVDKNGFKKTGMFSIDGYNYYYQDGFFIGTFVICGDTYSEGSQYSSSTIYVNNEGKQVFGWFNYGDSYLYASTSGYIAHDCFVSDGGQIRYVGSDGNIVYNKLITVDNIEVIIDESGRIINENYAINVINSNYVY